MTWTPALIAGIVGAGLGVGFLSGLLGVGGGFLMVPLLVSVFGVDWKIAIGSSLAQMIGMSAAGFRAHMRQGNVEWKLACFMLVFTISGGLLGHAIIDGLDKATVQFPGGETIKAADFCLPIIYTVTLGSLAAVTMREALGALRSKSGEDIEPRGKLAGIGPGPYLTLKNVAGARLSTPVTAAAAFATGIMIGLLGIGGGVILQPLMIYVLGVPTRIAIGTGLVMVFGTALVVVGEKAWDGHVDLTLVMLLLAASPVGVHIGARVCKRISSQRIRFLFAVVVLVALALVLRELVVLL